MGLHIQHQMDHLRRNKIKYIDEVSVIGIKNNLYGEVPIAFIKSKKKLSYNTIINELKKKNLRENFTI